MGVHSDNSDSTDGYESVGGLPTRSDGIRGHTEPRVPEDDEVGLDVRWRPKQKRKYRGSDIMIAARRLAARTKTVIFGAPQGHRISTWATVCLVCEFIALMAGILAVGYRSRRSRQATSDSRSRPRRSDDRKVAYATDSAGQRRWQKHIEEQARKKGIAIALLLGWIKSPYGEEEKVPSSAVDDASMYIGVARRNSSLGMARPNTQKRVADAKRALSAAVTEDLEQTEIEREAVAAAPLSWEAWRPRKASAPRSAMRT